MKSNITGSATLEINVPAEKVWEALTTPALIKKYFFNTDAESDWKEGSPITFSGEWEGKKYQDKGTILKVEKNKWFSYNYWSSMSGIEDKPENYAVISYILLERDGITTLAIEQENIPDEKMKEHSQQNWMTVLKNLKKMLEEKNA
ncbi:MAG: SRPBCC domain-containing protein [Bacteroidetes bacterium]|nr:SRPBCC domain-containing protein [Bacteroidota bacterium]